MLQNARSKIVFVVPFDLGHFQQAFNEIKLAAIARVPGGSFVLSDVAAFEFSRAIHGRKPAHHVAKQAQSPADNRSAHFARSFGAAPELGKHFADDPAVTPFIFLDGANRFSFILATH